ncbi:cysteine peptidase family C39 domain-containing protein [Mesoplasma coleopterae]|uniref:ABC transporter ATP-binding protein/permease n=1 Tax=Mesoplasma coleopterae TaxID=324078 RepID=A0A2K8P216_9MOLU|nr:cysteine peptidase family C39 domain-containing protein [Mesoplasma coleopterae]ATZ20797.1 ABC transporter ATP-binding protein/permease [Mesoplasma coleopterae]
MKIVRQTSYQDCGVACIAMMINHFYKYEIDLQQVKNYLSIHDDELSFYDIIDLASNFYLKGDAFKVDQDFLELKNKVPFLAQVVNPDGLLHFVIVERILQNDLIIFDPSKEKKIKQGLPEFLKSFNDNVIIFKSNIKEFNKDFKFNFKKFLNIFNFDFILYLIINLISTILFILDTQFLKMFSNSLSEKTQDFLIYLFPLIILLFNILFKNISIHIININYKKRKYSLLKKFSNLIETTNSEDLFYLYQEIKWVCQYENYSLKSSVSSLISEMVSLIFIYFIIKELFLIILISDIIYIFVNICINNFVKKDNLSSDKEWFNFLSNIQHIKNICAEYDVLNELIKLEEKDKLANSTLNWIEVWDKVGLILIYIISWSLLKNGNLEFSFFFIILLFKNFSRVNIFNLGQTIIWIKKYKIAIIKFEKIFIENNYINFNEDINNIEISSTEEKIKLIKGLNIINSKIDLGNINKTKNDTNVNVYINNKNISNLKTSDLRKHIYYSKNFQIKFGTIFQNITSSNNQGINIFTIKEINDLLNKYSIKITKLVKPETNTQLEKEIIKLLNVFYINKKVILIKNDFQIISFDEIKSILAIFTKLSNDKFLILS